MPSQQTDEKLFDVKKIEIEGDFLNSNVRCAYKDSRGFMWFGTAHGLCRYDGNGIIEFTTNNSELPFNDIFRIFEDDQGYLWILNRVHPTTTESIVFMDLSNFNIYDVEEQFGTALPLVLSIGQGKDAIIYFTEKAEIRYSYSKGNLKEEKDAIKYKNTHLSLYKVFEDNLEKEINKPLYDNITNRIFTNLGKDEKGNIIISSDGPKNRKIIKLDSSGNYTDYNDGLLKDLLQYKGSAYFHNKETGHIWSFNNSHLIFWDALGNTSHDFKVSYPKLFYDRVLKIEYHDGLIWVCASNGVFSIEVEKKYFDTHLKAASFLEGFNSCRSIYVDSHEDITVATVTKLIHITPKGEKIIATTNHSPFIDKKNDTLILGNRYINYLVDDEIKPITTIIASPIWSSEKDSYDTDLYWIGKGNGLSYWKTGMDTVATYDKVNGYDESKTTAIYDLYTLDNGNILMATSLGIYEFSSKEGIIQRYWEGGSSTYHLPLNEYYYIYQDEAGIFWLGSGGGGLVRWNKETGEYKQYTTENGFSSNMICAIYEDEEKNLWMSSYNGLIRFNKETEKIRIYKTENGLTHNEFNRGAHFKTADGKLYFGGTNGINSFYPKVLLAEEKNETVPLEVTSIYHFNSNADKLIDKLALFKREKKITLRPNEGFINIEFSLLDYRRKGNTTYAYKIEGQSDQWQYIKDNQLRVSGLSYGEYTVRVKGQMSNGSFSEKELVMNLCVLRPFYLKWWFILSTFLAFVFGLYQFIQWRGKWLIERGEELEKQVNKQTQQLQKQAIELKEVDKLKSRFFANVSHELRTPITLIQGPVRSVLNNENLDKDDKFLLTKVEENTEHLLSMVNELMDLTKAEAYKLEINESNVIFYDVLKRRLSSFQSLADMKSIQLDLEFHLDKDLGIALDVDKFGKIINNLLSNAFKFTPNEGEIKVTVEEESKNLLLKVADTGRGIPKADIPFIFNRFYQSSINKKAEGGLGIGLSLSMEFVKLLGGKMWIESKEGQGSTFFVSLPKKEIENISVDELNVFDKEQEHPKLEPRKLNSPPPIAVSNTDSEFLSQQIILVVEDNLDLQEYLHYLLAPHYYEIHVVNNGKEALEWITANRFPSLILSDLMMPIMDGFELLEQVKADKKLSSIPFIMLTARAELRDKLKALRIGVDDYLTKPFKEEELKVRINNLLSNFEERREYLMSEQPGHAGLKDEEQHLPETSDDDRMWLKNLEKIIIEEIGHHYFSIDYLAEKIGVKRDKLFKRTKALTGLTPNKYVRAVRLQLAKELLENKEYATVKDVAHKVGFQKIEYFSTLYKKQFGKSPSEYIR